MELTTESKTTDISASKPLDSAFKLTAADDYSQSRGLDYCLKYGSDSKGSTDYISKIGHEFKPQQVILS